jgi:AraC-like DNA-binding protein
MMMSILILPLVYYGWGLALLKRYQKRIKNYFSDIAQVDLQWLRVLLLSSLIMAGIINSTFFVDQFVPVAPFGMLQAASYVFVSVYVLFLGFFGHKQEVLITKIPLQAVQSEDGQNETPIPDEDELFIYRLLECMKQEKPYLAPELTISVLSEQLQVSEEYLSGILNSKLHRNFFDFVNQYRVDEFKTLCSNPENDKLTLIALAFDSGFNSKATFNRVFKNATGLTPSAYKQSVSEK